MDRGCWVHGGVMDHIPLKAIVFAGLACCATPSQALQMTFTDGRPGYIESINSVTYGKAMAKIRWNDALGNVRRAVVALEPVASRVASLVPMIISKRLIVGTAVTYALAEAMEASLNRFFPGTTFAPDGTPFRPANAPQFDPCESNLISLPDADGVKHAAYGYLPCYAWASAPTRLVLRLPLDSNWSPPNEWLHQYGTGSDQYRDAWGATKANPGQSTRVFREVIRPQPDKKLELKADPKPLTAEEQTQAFMQPDVVGPLAGSDALPGDLWKPVDPGQLESDPGTTPPGEESNLPQDTTMDDVDRNTVDVRQWFKPKTWGWLPRTCTLPGPITPVAKFPDWKIDFKQYENDFCPLIGTYVVPASDLTAIIIFLSLVLRVRTGGA